MTTSNAPLPGNEIPLPLALDTEEAPKGQGGPAAAPAPALDSAAGLSAKKAKEAEKKNAAAASSRGLSHAEQLAASPCLRPAPRGLPERPRPVPSDPLAIFEVYTDGGLIGPKNPSEIGGVFAWCYVNARGERISDVLAARASHALEEQLAALASYSPKFGEPLRKAASLEEILDDLTPTITRAVKGEMVTVRQPFSAAGILPASLLPRGFVSGNAAEVAAVAAALRWLPPGWQGRISTDSEVTLSWLPRLFDPSGPARLKARSKVEECVGRRALDRLLSLLARAGRIEWRHVKGHPSKAAPAAGFTDSGVPVSPHNVWCDDACNALKIEKGFKK